MFYDSDFMSASKLPKYVGPKTSHLLEISHGDDGHVDSDITEEEKVLDWLEKAAPAGRVGGMRAVFLTCKNTEMELPFADEVEFESAMRCMRLAHCIDPFLGYLRTSRAYGSRFVAFHASQILDESQVWIIRTMFPRQATICISYHPQTNMVSAFGIFSHEFLMLHVIDKLQKFAVLASHPMLIPTLLAVNILDYHSDQLNTMQKNVWELEKRAGVRDFSDQSNDNFIADTQKVIRDSVDLKARLADLISFLQPVETTVLRPTIEGIRAVEEHAKEASSSSSSSSTASENRVQRQLLTHGLELEAQIEALTQDRVAILAFLENLITKTETTISALYNMFVQRDSKLNMQMGRDSQQLTMDSKINAEQSVDIAIAAKRDSSSMKSIAVLTTAFLPGTYVATVSATPMVDWAPADFWKYWAVTVPLTFVVMGIWVVYMLIDNRILEGKRAKAQEKLRIRESA